MRFKGKISWWFYLIVFSTVILLVPIILLGLIDKDILAVCIIAVTLISVEGFVIPIIFNNYAELKEDSVFIVFGYIKKNIPYSDISGVSCTNDPSASLAASLDRIKISCKNSSDVMVSLIEKENFLNAVRLRMSDKAMSK